MNLITIIPLAYGCFAYNESCKLKVIHNIQIILQSSKHKVNEPPPPLRPFSDDDKIVLKEMLKRTPPESLHIK